MKKRHLKAFPFWVDGEEVKVWRRACSSGWGAQRNADDQESPAYCRVSFAGLYMVVVQEDFMTFFL